MPNKIYGRFYFKKTSNGNLIGEWSNRESVEVSTESADLFEPGEDPKVPFVGKYHTTWQENGNPRHQVLDIKKKQQNSPIYALRWGNDAFTGEAMLCDDILVGDYRSGK
jgi:hypothetical protein